MDGVVLTDIKENGWPNILGGLLIYMGGPPKFILCVGKYWHVYSMYIFSLSVSLSSACVYLCVREIEKGRGEVLVKSAGDGVW